MANPSHDLTVTSGDRQVTLDDLDRHLATCQRCVTYGRALACGT